MQDEPEDQIDRMMVQAWQNMAMSLRAIDRQLGADVRGGIARRRDERERRDAERERLGRRLETWRQHDMAELNTGFEKTVRATALDPRVLRDPSMLGDRELLKLWTVTGHLEEHDPGFARQNRQARMFLESTWTGRGHERPIGEAADAMAGPRVIVAAAAPSPALDATLDAFRRAGIHTTVHDADDPAAFPDRHGGETFAVATSDGDGWDGWDREKVTEAVLAGPVDSLDAAADRITLIEQGMQDGETASHEAKAAPTRTDTRQEHARTQGSGPVGDGSPAPQDDLFEPEGDAFGVWDAEEEVAVGVSRMDGKTSDAADRQTNALLEKTMQGLTHSGRHRDNATGTPQRNLGVPSAKT